MAESSDLHSKTFQRAERHLRGKLRSGYLQKYDHHVVPGYNLNKSFHIDEYNIDNIKELYQKFPYDCDLPKPLLPPAKLNRNVLHNEDPALETITVKSRLKDDINRNLDYYEKYKKEIKIPYKRTTKWCSEDEEKTTELPKFVAEIAELIELDPDPYLKGNYNFYCTGGCLSNITLGDQTILIYPYVGELVASPLMSMENALWKPILKKSTKLNLDGTLYELRCNNVDNTSRILGRYKNHCILYKLFTRDNKLRLLEIHKQTSELPYVSGDLSIFNQNHYCTVDVDRNVSIWDLNKVKSVSSNKILCSKVLDNGWGSIRYQFMDPYVLTFMDRCCLHYLDTRMPFDLPALSLCLKPYLEQCEYLSVETGSRYSSCRYIGTCHNLFLSDNRSPNQCVSQKWIHLFRNIPLLLPTINRDEEEILVLSSLSAGENSVIVNTWTNDDSHSYNLPLILPSRIETLNESQLQGLCLDPYLKNRLEMSNVGSTLLTDQNRDVFLFLQTSIGDVFYQCITHKYVFDEHSTIKEKSISALNAWEEALLTQTDPIVPLTISGKCNMMHLYKSFTDRNLRLKEKKQVIDGTDQKWRQTIEELNSYEDILASELLAVWGISEQDFIPLASAPHEKVLSWLEASDTKEFSVPQEDVEYLPTPVNTQELVSVSQDPDITYLNDSNALQDLLLPKVTLKSSSKKKNTRT